METCQSCTAFEATTQTCRAAPPIVVAERGRIGGAAAQGPVWPQVSPTDWCRQHEPVA